MRSTSSGRTSPSSGHSPPSSWRWAPSPWSRTAARPRSSSPRRRRAAPSSARRSPRSRSSSGPPRSLAVAVGWFYTAILFEPPPVAGWIGLAILGWLSLGAWAAIAFLGSTVTGSTAAAAGIGFMALLILSVVTAIPSVGAYTPGGLAAPAIALATGAPVDAGAIVTPVVSTLVLIGVALAASVWSFRRREL